MSLSGFLPNGLVSRSARTSFGRSFSCEDLSSTPSGSKDPIQLFASTPGKAPLIRVLATEAISAVNLKIRGDMQHCIFPASPHGSLRHSESSADSMRFVLGLSDLLHVSVATDSGKHYFCSEWHTRESRRHVDRIEEECGDDGGEDSQLVSALEAFQHRHHGLNRRSLPEELHLVADRTKSKVFIREGAKSNCIELSVLAAPSFSETEVWSPRLSCKGSPLLLEDGFFDCEELFPEVSLLDHVMEGLVSGHLPELTEEGTGGTYFLSDPQGQKVAVFKPVDEEPLALNCPRGMTPSTTGEGLKKGTRVGEGAFREVAAHILDYPAVDVESGFAGVPLTFLAKCSNEYFGITSSDDPLSDLNAVKLGSLQQFVQAVSNCEDMGPQHFPKQEVHKIAILDMRLANTDRNGANILVQKDDSGFRLIPIDHGYCLPETLEDCTFEWLYWPQAKMPFDDESLAYIYTLDAEEDIHRLNVHGWEVNAAVAKTMRACTALLKTGAARGLTPFDIGSMMVREDFNRLSALELMVEMAEAQADREELSNEVFISALSRIMDQELAALPALH